MRYRKLHGTDLELSELGFGTWTLTTGWWGTYTDDEARRMISRAVDRGINYIDTADAYGNGRGETVLAPILAEHPEVIVGTKFGYDFYNNPERPRGQRELPQDMSPKFIRFALEQSLKRLGTDHVAIYQPHNPRIETLLTDEHWETLEALRAEGKISSFGPSLGPAIGWRDEGIYANGARSAPVTQLIYNLLEQDPGRELILAAERAEAGQRYGAVDEAAEAKSGKKACAPTQHFEPSFRAWKTPHLEGRGPQFLIRVTHSSGMLEGQYTIDTKFDESDHRSHRPRAWLVEGIQKVDRLQALRAARGVTMSQLALLWLYAHPSMLSALPNIYNDAQLDEFLGASDHPPLNDGEMEQVQELYERNFDITPYVEEVALAT
ncbi:MAG: putative oxidoreductase (related to aryl-alcohol dehydrogenase) [Acidobacteria bacterium]|nr:putative oxidoreductase (related to aryl-alcohol dehydrogenase) [Acidobacteriota bacterium]